MTSRWGEKIDRHQRIIVACFFFLLLITGIAIHRDYGISWDEPTQRAYGETVFKHYFFSDPKLLSDPDRYHGPAFELFLNLAQKLLHLRDTQAIYTQRHLLTFLLFFLGVYFFYRLCRERFDSAWIGLLGALWLVLSPRLFGQAFYNSKDLPFLSLFIISIFTLSRMVRGMSPGAILAHALVGALLISVRVLGVLVPVLTLGAILLDREPWAPDRRTRWALGAAAYLLFLSALTVAFWPVLWQDPWGQFWAAIHKMKQFPWSGNLIYFGAAVPAPEIPWHYSLVWIGITTPVAYLALFLAGLAALAHDGYQGWRTGRSGTRRLDLIVLFWFLVPLGSTIFMRSTLYGAWRHLYFIYPALLYIALLGLTAGWRFAQERLHARASAVLRTAAVALLTLQAGSVLAFLYRSHPCQDVYFNALVGGVRGARFRFDLDYWGLSYRPALQFLLDQVTEGKIRVYCDSSPGVFTAEILKPADRERLVFAKELPEADYFIGNYTERLTEYALGSEIYAVRVGGAKILTIQRLPARKRPEDSKGPQTLLDTAVEQNRQSGTPPITTSRWKQLSARPDLFFSDYVRDAAGLTLAVLPDPAQGGAGLLAELDLTADRVLLGDFAHQPAGVPVRNLRIKLRRVVVDTAKLAEQKFVPRYIDSAQIGSFQLAAGEINDALAAMTFKEGAYSVAFREGRIELTLRSKITLGAALTLERVPDPRNPDYDNLRFTIRNLRLGLVPVPGRLVQWAVERYNPVFRDNKIIRFFQFQQLRVQDGRMTLGDQTPEVRP